METYSALLGICAGNSPVTGEFPAQRPVTRSLMSSFICGWLNGWVSNCKASDLRRRCVHYDVIVMAWLLWHSYFYQFIYFHDFIPCMPKTLAISFIFYEYSSGQRKLMGIFGFNKMWPLCITWRWYNVHNSKVFLMHFLAVWKKAIHMHAWLYKRLKPLRFDEKRIRNIHCQYLTNPCLESTATTH